MLNAETLSLDSNEFYANPSGIRSQETFLDPPYNQRYKRRIHFLKWYITSRPDGPHQFSFEPHNVYSYQRHNNNRLKKRGWRQKQLIEIFSKDKVSICFVPQSKVRQRVIHMKEATGKNRFSDKKKSDIDSIPCLTNVQCCISHYPIRYHIL